MQGADMTRVRLDQKLDCKACGTIQMGIPEGAAEQTAIHCSNCAVRFWANGLSDFHPERGVAGSRRLVECAKGCAADGVSADGRGEFHYRHVLPVAVVRTRKRMEERQSQPEPKVRPERAKARRRVGV